MSAWMPLAVIRTAWLIILLVWFVTGFNIKGTQQRQPMGPRLLHILALVAAYSLVFNQYLAVGWLALGVVPQAPVFLWTGTVLTLAGVGIAVWARLVLGRNWSGTITLKLEHTLIRTGPYQWVRHPIYSGLVLAMFGTAIAEGLLGDFCGVALLLVSFLLKSRSEDNLMHRAFGAEHAAYCERTGALLPKLR
jgi:protein-S-isoprenylcysteine O-methyltransferase